MKNLMKALTLGTALTTLGLVGCTSLEQAPSEAVSEVATAVPAFDSEKMAGILDAQDDAAKARYDQRHPAETLAFFGIAPGMKVAEALPGGGWYSKILLPYLGPDGELVGAHYPDDMWPRFGFGEEFVTRQTERANAWTTTAADWTSETGASISDYKLTAMPDEMEGTLDAVVFIRALHNLNRFNTDAGYMDKTLTETFKALKPGGIVGVVQHRAPEGSSNEWASGANGYLKQSFVIAAFEGAGFELVETSEINANAKDQPGETDFVWRLPPSLNGTEEGTPERAAMEAIGESDRMTLKFRKPS